MRSHYTYDKFLEAAKECEDKRSVFIKQYRRLYEYSSKKVSWYKDYPWRKLKNDGQNKYLIYCYKDIDNKAVYIGLSCNLKDRKSKHRSAGTVYEYFADSPIPEPEILISGLSSGEARKLEGAYVEKFRNQGWHILNKAKTGEQSSSLGGYNDKLTYEKCFIISKKYKTKSDFQRGDVSAYRRALEEGWLDGWYSNVDRKKWTRKSCSSEAQKYKTRSEFRIKSQSAYKSALKNGWLHDYTWFVKSTRKSMWDENACYRAAKDCGSRAEFARRFSSAYKKAVKNGWIENYDWFNSPSESMRGRRKWTYDACKRLALKYKKRWDFGKENSGAYHACLRNHWLDSFDWFDK